MASGHRLDQGSAHWKRGWIPAIWAERWSS